MSAGNPSALLGRFIAGRYQLETILGQGGMATVYKARQPALERYVAIKVISPALSNEPTFVERFRREAQIVARLQHPHILTIHDFGEDAEVLFLVTELISGGTLRDRLQTPLPLADALTILDQVGSALDYAHRQGLVHRDVKPGNIFLRDGAAANAVLADFGIAKAVEEAAGAALTQTGAGIGTPEYIAPEQALGQPVDGRADLYALGIILYELVAGRPPFKRETVSETPLSLTLRQVKDLPPSPRLFNPALAPALEQVVLRAIAKQPGDRYPTAAALLAAVRAALDTPSVDATAPLLVTPSGAPTFIPPRTASPPYASTPPVPFAPMAPPPLVPRPYQPERGRSNAAWPLLFGIVLLALLAVGGALAATLLRSGSATPTVAQLSTAPATPPATLAMAMPSATAPPATSAPPATPTMTPRAAPTATTALAPTPAPTPSPAIAAPPGPDPRVQTAARDALAALPGTATGMFLNLGSGSEVVLRDADKVMPTGSVIKLLIAGEAYRQVASGRLTLTDPFTVKQSDVVGGTGILQNQVGKTYTLDQLVEITLLYSDNTGANMLIDRVGGFTPVNDFAASLGLTNTRLNRRLADTAAQARGIENTSTAREISLYFLKLHLGQVVNPTTSSRILSILTRRAEIDRNWLLLDIPANVRAAHISGTLTGLRVDAGIVSPVAGAQPYILVIFDQNRDEPAAERAIASASLQIFRALTAR